MSRHVSTTTRPQRGPRRVETRLDDDTGHDEVRDVSRHVLNTPGMRSQGQTTKQGFVVCALGASFFLFFLFSFISKARDTRLEPFFSYFLYHHHHQGPRRVSDSGFLFFILLFITKALRLVSRAHFFLFFFPFIHTLQPRDTSRVIYFGSLPLQGLETRVSSPFFLFFLFFFITTDNFFYR